MCRRKEARWSKARTKWGGMLGGGVKYLRREARKEILIPGMCIRVWPKQIDCRTSFFDLQGGRFVCLWVTEKERQRKKERAVGWANEGGGWMQVGRKRWRFGEMWRDRPVSRAEGKGECDN